MATERTIGRLLGGLLLAFLTLFYLASCSSSSAQQEKVGGSFSHGIASGDPGRNSVVLWTRYITEDSSSTQLIYELSQDKDFTNVMVSGEVQASKANDFCVKTVVKGLDAGQHYFYRFSNGTTYSTTGKTKTLPLKAEKIKIGVVNCAKYTGGYYNAYEELAKMEDVDVVIHLGDYIYENGPSTPKSSYWQAYQKTGRQHNPMHACVTLQDYRTRYAQYRADTSLLKLHAQFPMIAIWDDHEIAMNAESDEVEDDDEAVQIEKWEERRDNSIKAYHEWIPLAPEPFSDIYRSFQFGNLVNLLMLDTRVCCKSEVTKTKESLEDTSRHIVGNQQLQWIFNEIERHDAFWNVFGNQLLIAEKGKGWNRWQGFPRDRDRFLEYVENNPTKNMVFTTGNAHNPHHYIVFNKDKTDTLLHELLPGSISSGNNAEKARFDPKILAKEDKRLREAENVLWYHQDSHGFIVLEIEEEKLIGKWYFVSTIWDKEYELLQPYTVTLHTKRTN